MHANHLTFSRGGVSGSRRSGPQRLYRVSPYLFPQQGILNGYSLPEDRELPTAGIHAQVLVFDFGFATPSQRVAPMDAQFFPLTLGSNFLAIAITGVSDVPPSQAVVPGAPLPAGTTFPAGIQVDPAYLVTLSHTHQGNTWQFANKATTNREACGTARNPLFFKRPILLPIGDTVGCMVQNMANATVRIQITLIGGTF